MTARRNPETLYVLCLDFCIPRLEKKGRELEDAKNWTALEELGGSVAEDLLTRAFQLANKEKSFIIKKWKNEWKIFYTSKISSAILCWDEDLITHVRDRCKALKRIEVIHIREFQPKLVLKCPSSLLTLDFDGELVNRGKLTLFECFQDVTTASWLRDSEKVLRSILISNVKAPEYGPGAGTPSLTEVHLGNVSATAEDLIQIINNCKNLRLLKHYQLVSALYKLHAEAWRQKKALPVYKLRNLDVDFSHVVRCRMSPEWVLSPDALLLAIKLCPKARSIRIRFDCSTPHDVLAPIANLESIREFSAVCVSSGERSNMDFSDMIPIFQKHGPNDLTYLELKVIEEVEIHVIIEVCTKLDTLVLSGCGYVTPRTCASYSCQSYKQGSLHKLRLLFYADGDDFSWDHGVPECFWKATLLPSGMNRVMRLEGIFLEYPRIPRSLTSLIFASSGKRLPFPNLIAISLCRYEEITADDIAFICGLRRNDSESQPCRSLRYIRLFDCKRIDEAEGKRLKMWLKQSSMNELRVHLDR